MISAEFPKTLVISRSVPPAATGSGIVMHNLLRQFTKDEMIVVGAYYVGHPQSEWHNKYPKIIYGAIHPPEFWRGHRWLRIIQFPLLFIISLWTLLFRQCQVILTIYPDDIFLFTGYLLSRLFQKPLFLYFHNSYLENSPENSFAKWLQPRVFSRAKHIFVISDGLKNYYNNLYPDVKFSSLTHTIPDLPDRALIEEPPLHSPIRLVFAGNVNGSCEDAARRFAQLINDDPDFELHIFSGMSPKSFRQRGFTGNNIIIKTVPYDQLLEKMRKGDIVIHPHGFLGPMAEHEYQTIFPTKTIEYLLCQRPILAHLPESCYLAEFYRKHDCALIVSEPTLDALKRGIESLYKGDLRLRLVNNALKVAHQFYAPLVANKLRQTVTDCLKNSKKGQL